MLSLENVSVVKSGIEILTNLSLTINRGEKVAVVGTSGSGKSTLLDLLAGKVFPQKGKVTKPHYSKIGMVHRDYSFHKIVGSAYQYYQQRYHAFDSEIGPTLWEVLQNQVKPIGTVDEKSVDLPELPYSNEYVDEVAKKINVYHLLHRKVTTLSNGETRRALICLALLKDPEVLLLDNPFTGLDVESKAALSSILCELETTLVLVCSQSEIPECFSKRIALNRGEVVPIDSISRNISREVASFKKGQFQSLFNFGKESTPFSIAFSIKNGWVHYGSKKALDAVNWTVKSKEKWALMGPNGSGKSTLLSLIMADNPQAYQNEMVLFDKPRGSGESIWDLKKKTGYVSPEYHLYFPKNQRVWKVVASGLFDTIGLIHKLNTEQEETLKECIKLLDLDSIQERALNTLSTGEQRRVLLARALIKNPPLLILDEPCQNLDYGQMVYFRELINNIVTTLNKTLIYVTHNREEIPSCVDKTLFLEDGKVLKIEG